MVPVVQDRSGKHAGQRKKRGAACILYLQFCLVSKTRINAFGVCLLHIGKAWAWVLRAGAHRGVGEVGVADHVEEGVGARRLVDLPRRVGRRGRGREGVTML